MSRGEETPAPADTGFSASIGELFLAFVAALVFYSATLAPTVAWGDSAWLSLHAFWGTTGWGTAGDHPLFVLVGHLFTWLPGDVARNVNLASAMFGALTVMLVYRCTRLLGADALAASAGASALAVSHAFWLHAVIAEVYTANAFFLLAVLTLLIAWSQSRSWTRLALACAVFLIGLMNHLVLATAGPAMLAFVVMTARRSPTRRGLLRTAGVAVMCLLATLAYWQPLSETFIRLWVGPPSISEYVTLRVSPAPMAREAGFYALYLAYQFPSIALALALAGGVTLVSRQRPAAVLLLLVIATNAFVFLRHTDWVSAGSAKYVFYIADYAVIAVLCGVGAQRVLEWVDGHWGSLSARYAGMSMLGIVVLLPVMAYAMAPALARSLDVDVVRARSLPYRDNLRFFLNPSKRGDDGARRFGTEALDLVARGAVIYADFTPCSVLKYLQFVEKRRPDVLACGQEWGGSHVVVRWLYDQGKRRPTYVVSTDGGYYDFSGLTEPFDLVPAGPIFEVRPR